MKIRKPDRDRINEALEANGAVVCNAKIYIDMEARKVTFESDHNTPKVVKNVFVFWGAPQ